MNPYRRLLRSLILCCGLIVGAAFAEDTAVAEATLKMGGNVQTPLQLTAKDLASLPRQTITATEKGDTAEWQGVALIELLREAGAPGGEALRGRALSLLVRVTAADGYRAIFALADLDPAIGNGVVLLADRRNSEPLGEHIGPFRLVVPGDKRPARWVRQVVSIDLIDAP